MKKPKPDTALERVFPFVLRSRNFFVGREILRRSRSHLQFLLVTNDLSPSSLAEVRSDFAPYPIVQCYSSEDLERFFGLNGTKVIGFKKSGLAKSVYAELKAYRINKPPPVTPREATGDSPG